jgi:predicted nuclease with TOPRIM domain
MDNATITAIVTCLITGLLSAGGWKFYESVLKTRAAEKKEQKLERLAYRDDLIARVDKLESERSNYVEALTILRTEVAALKMKMSFIEQENTMLKLKLESKL